MLSDPAAVGFAAIGVSILIGLRHAADPDHLVGLGAIVAGNGTRGNWRDGSCATVPPKSTVRAARSAALAWSAGHAVTTLLAGAALIAVNRATPNALALVCELLVALTIGWLISDLIRHRRNPDRLELRERQSKKRSFGLGSLHGLAGSGSATIVALTALPAGWDVAALVCFCAGSCLSMLLATQLFARLITSSPDRARKLAMPIGAIAGLGFSCWMALTTMGELLPH